MVMIKAHSPAALWTEVQKEPFELFWAAMSDLPLSGASQSQRTLIFARLGGSPNNEPWTYTFTPRGSTFHLLGNAGHSK